MKTAICFNCGDFKQGPLATCSKCGATPTGEDKTASMSLTDRYHHSEDLLAISNAIKSRHSKHSPYKTADQIKDDLITVFQTPEVRNLYFQVAPYPEGSEEWLRFSFTSYLYVMITSLLVSKSCANPDMASVIANCHLQMIDYWDGEESLVRFGDYILTVDEELHFIEHCHLKIIAFDARNIKSCQITFANLLRSAFFVRFQLYGEDVQKAQIESPDGNLDMDILFEILAMRFQRYIAVDTFESFKRDPYRETFINMTVKECLKTYSQLVSSVLNDQ